MPGLRRARRIDSRLHLPKWLWNKLGFLVSGKENRETFFERIAKLFPVDDPRYQLIRRAYETAKRAFDKDFRDSGERYFEHLRMTTLILIEYLRVRDANLICAMLLHDIVEDKPDEWTIERVALEFNREIAMLVFWVTKPAIGPGCPTKADQDRQYHQQLRDAPREAIMLKVCDRLHNLITMWAQEPEKRRRKVDETYDFILPLAEQHQLLIHELEAALLLVIEGIKKHK